MIINKIIQKFYQIEKIDIIIGLLIFIYIFCIYCKIIIKEFNVLMDRELTDEERENIFSIIKTHPEVIEVRDLRTRSSGLHQFFQLNLIMRADLTLREADLIANAVEEEVIKAYPKSQVMIRLVSELP
jgi:ferrous-iron efflux pump FieF